MLKQDSNTEDSLQSKPVELSTKPRRRSDWIAPWLIVGSYALVFVLLTVSAIFLAVSHYTYFKVLDGRITKGPFLQRQSTVNAISLLIVTTFRALVVYSVGACFTQYMWRLFRTHAFRIRLIEVLFQIRANIWELANFNVVRHAPLLFLIAGFSWLIPLAMVYPPGALTIHTEFRSRVVPTNVSTFNTEYMSEIELLSPFDRPDFVRGTENVVWDTYTEPSEQVMRLAGLVLNNGALVSQVSPKGENCSYTLEFEGPLYRCDVETKNVTKKAVEGEGDLFAIAWTFDRLRRGRDMEHTLQSVASEPVGILADAAEANDTDRVSTGITFNSAQIASLDRTQVCRLHTATYSVNITFAKGTQSITYSLRNEKLLEYFFIFGAFKSGNNTKKPLVSPADAHPPEPAPWEDKYLAWRRKTHSFSLMDVIGKSLIYNKTVSFYTFHNDIGSYRFENGTRVNLTDVYVSDSYTDRPGSLVENTIFNDKRFTYIGTDPAKFNPSRDLNISEARLNDVLFNLTMSTLSLGLWHQVVDVNETYVAAVYRFSEPLQFFLPYSLCIGLTAAVMVVGLVALRKNGVAATDGGFLQIVMTTTGDTEMKRAALPGCIGGRRNAPEDLLDMRVRFGELESRGSTVRRAGFGTVEETVPLRKRVVYGKTVVD